MLFGLAAGLTFSTAVCKAADAVPGGAQEIAWPLRASGNGRYITDSKGVPVLLIGDSAQSLFGSVSEADAETYLANRHSKGINANWAHLYTSWGAKLHGNPFTSGDGVGSDISEPNEAYFAHVDRVLNLAKKHGITIFLGVPAINGMTTADGGELAFTRNGAERAAAFGMYLGNRYKNQGNMVWTIGNDYKGWNSPTDRVVRAFMDGVLAADTGRHLMSAELYPTPCLSWDAPEYRSRIHLNLSYTYAPTYVNVKRGYNQGSGLPLIMFECIYEDDGSKTNGRHGYRGTDRILRSTLHWSIQSGALGGYFYGHEGTWELDHNDLTTHLDTPAVAQLTHARNLYAERRWYDLLPDLKHEIVTAGYGEFPAGAEWNYDIGLATATTAAATPDGRLMIAYMERNRDTTVNMAKMAGPTIAKWFNPTTGAYTTIAGSPLANTGSHVFRPPGTGDWVLLLESPQTVLEAPKRSGER
jgi:hypothetical protein